MTVRVCVFADLFSLIVSDAAIRAAELVALHITNFQQPTLKTRSA